ncbi:MAG: hypothetical protein H0X71_07955 [Rubrobacter sp.]|nr:hypothetical protein [Rubrobacter sp.]
MVDTGEDEREWQGQKQRRERRVKPSGKEPCEGGQDAGEGQEEAGGAWVRDLWQ